MSVDSSSGMYSHPIAAMALCEAAGMTQDKELKDAARAATDFIVKAQGGNGSWGYTAGTEGFLIGLRTGVLDSQGDSLQPKPRVVTCGWIESNYMVRPKSKSRRRRH